MFDRNDHADLKLRGISEEEIENQVRHFSEGFPFLPITKPAVAGDGILKPREETLDDFVRLYEYGTGNQIMVKFVPASGAATRMFKDLYAFVDSNGKDPSGKEIMRKFITGLREFAFYDDLKKVLEAGGESIESLIKSGSYTKIVAGLLDRDGLNYSGLPKGLLAFHRYGMYSRTAFEEHLVESALYCKGGNNEARIHLTVSPEHQGAFKNLFNRVRTELEDSFMVSLQAGFSTQKPSTDTIAVDTGNNPFRNSKGKLVFRPGGHGALLDNLDCLDADLVFIKNIDNVVPDHLKGDTVKYKKALGGMLLSFRERIYDYLNTLEDKDNCNEGLLEEILIFLEQELFVIPPPGTDLLNNDEKRKYLISKLNRPVRICGMVRNEGEPGGGPFWVRNSDGSVALQIVESSQINLGDPLMKKIFDASTHFNPVDLVCSLKDYNGNKFRLHSFRDPGTGFISSKTYEGKEIRAMELPGLWNGSMADWNTVFVEVPVSTFNPVKTVFDLLRPQHAPE